MAPAPIPADPTVLSSPLNSSNKQLASGCVSRRFATPVALSSIQSPLSQQNQFAANTVSDSAVSIAEDQQSFNGNESRLEDAPLHDIQSSRHTIKSSSFNITTVDAFEEFTRINTSTTVRQIQQSEALVVCEVPKSYNRLSLNNKVQFCRIITARGGSNFLSIKKLSLPSPMSKPCLKYQIIDITFFIEQKKKVPCE